LFQVLFACQQLQHRILSQLLVVVDIFVSQRQSVYSLGNHFRYCMLDSLRIPSIEKTLGKARQQFQTSICFP
jgi:hypothetical protein